MTLNAIMICSAQISWVSSFSGPFAEFRSLANLLERTGAISHWAIVLKNGQGLYVEEGIIKSLSPLAMKSLEWFDVSNSAYLGVPLYVDSNFIHDALPVISALIIADNVVNQNIPLGQSESIADGLPFLVSYIDQNLRYQYVNNHYEDVFQIPKDQVIGMHVSEVLGQEHFKKLEPFLYKALAGESVEFQIPATKERSADPSFKHYVVCNYQPRIVDGVVTGLYVYVLDQTPLKRITQALKQFHDLTSQTDLSLDEKINRVLALGCEILDLPVGIVSHVEGQDYEVAYSYSPNGEPAPGLIFELGNCYCVHTLNRNQVTGFYHAGKSEIATHPCYENFKLESYLGVAIHLNNEVWGTLNFSGMAPRTKDFSEDEYELVKLFGQWVSNELTRFNIKQAIIDAEQQHRLILDSVSDGIVGLDQNGTIMFVNLAVATLVGVDACSLIGEQVSKLLPVSSDAAASSSYYESLIYDSVKYGRKTMSSDARFFRSDGTQFPVKLSCTPVDNASPNDISCVLTFQDITEQESAQEALIEQMNLFKSLFMDAPEAIVLMDKNRHIVMANPHTLKLFDYEESDLIGHSPDFLYADKAAAEQAGEIYTDTNTPDREEYRIVYKRSDGVEFIADNVRSKLTDTEGNLKGFLVHARDITARLKIEEDIAQAKNRLSMATAAAGIGVWEMDMQERSLIFDHRMKELYGLSEKDFPLDYDTWASMVNPDDLARVESALEHAIAVQQDISVTFKITRTDGAVRHIKASGRMELDGNGEPLYLFGTNIDVTQQYNTELVLREAREKAIRASQAKSNFLATMSHEIRTPLNGVLGMAEVLSTSPLTKQQHNQLDVIRDSGESLLELINEILDFSKIEAGHLTLELIDFDLKKLVYDLSKLLVIRAEAKGIELLVCYEMENAPVMRGDAYRIRQILTNLVGNAIKFTETGQVVITVRGQLSDNDDLIDLQLEVQDSGIGISKSAQGQLFQAFTQADSSTTRKFGGTGLGLAITKQLVDLMGGGITIESELGKGSRFTVSLPLKVSHELLKYVEDEDAQTDRAVLSGDDNAAHIQSIKANQNRRSVSNKASPLLIPNPIETKVDVGVLAAKRILVVEDMLANQAVVQGMLKPYNVTVVLAGNGVEAIEKWQQGGIDLILMDLHMPVMDGISTIKAIRTNEVEGQRRVPILVLTADIQPDRVAEVKSVGGDGFIAKPFRIDELVSTISVWLQKTDGTAKSGKSSMSITEQNNSSALDESVLSGLDEVLGDQVQEIVNAFIQDVEGVLAQLNTALESEEMAAEMIRPTHSLKSVSANVGAMVLSRLAADLEAKAKVNDMADPHAAVVEIKEEFVRVKEHLQRMGRLS